MGYEYMKVRGLCVDVSYLVMGPLENNVYILSDGESAIVVDPCMDADAIIGSLGDLKLEAIVITHAHWDHTGAAAELRDDGRSCYRFCCRCAACRRALRTRNIPHSASLRCG